MSHTKKILAAAIVSGLFATSAQAQVNLSATTAAPAVLYAQEIIATSTAPVTLGAITANGLQSNLLFAFGATETRWARVECSPHVLLTVSTADITVSGSGVDAALNGAGTNAITFSITSPVGGLLSTDTVIVAGTRSITGATAGTCSYALYSTQLGAINAVVADRFATTAVRPYLSFGSSYLFTTTTNTSTASVSAVPSFTSFLASGLTTAPTAHLAGLTYGLVGTVPLLAAGTAIALTDLMATGATGTRITVSGDFSAAANADTTYTGAALNRVFISTANNNCTLGTAASAPLTATTATFNVGTGAVAGLNLCFTPLAGAAIPVADYTALLNAVSATPAQYAVSNIGPRAAGSIVRDGTSLQAPLAQVPGGWLSRMVLTNTGSVDRTYTIAVTGETGNTIGTANLTGTVPANGTRVVDLTTVLTSFTAAPRATLNVTIIGPNNQIQGLYQIVNPASGSISNHVMVRPNTN